MQLGLPDVPTTENIQLITRFADAELNDEEEAKRAWLASQDHFSTAPAEEDAPALRAFVASPAPPLAVTATEAEVLAQGERLLNEPGLNLTEQEKEAVRMAMAIIRRE